MSTPVNGSGEQIPLQFFQFEPLRLEQFIEGKNALALESIRSIINKQETKPLYLWGKPSTGKSHLLQAACENAAQTGQGVAYVPVEIILNHSEQSLEGLEDQDIVCIDDIHLISGHSHWQKAFFHLYNRVIDNGKRLIVSSRDSHQTIDIELADLKSRFAWGHVVQLEELGDQDKVLLLQQKARQRSFELSNEVAAYLLKRANRELEHLLSVLDMIDRNSLAQKRKITIPFVKTILEQN